MTSKMTRFSIALLFAGAACSHSLDRDAEARADSLSRDADALLARSHLKAASEKYEEVLALSPRHAHAAFGAALTDTLLLPDAKPIIELLAVCGQAPMNVERNVFGPTGLLSLDVEHRRGAPAITVHHRPIVGGPWQKSPFVADQVRTEIVDGTLRVTLTDVRMGDADDSADLTFFLGIDDTDPEDDAITPLVDGTVLDASSLNSALAAFWSKEMITYWGSDPDGFHQSGSIVFHGDPKVGSQISVELRDLTLGADVPDDAAMERSSSCGSPDR
jgi:hypothetical protein